MIIEFIGLRVECKERGVFGHPPLIELFLGWD